MKSFFLFVTIALAAAMSISLASGVNVPAWGANSSIIEKVKYEKGKKKLPRKRGDCYNKCYKDSGCEGDIVGTCDDYCWCICAGENTKKCPNPS